MNNKKLSLFVGLLFSTILSGPAFAQTSPLSQYNVVWAVSYTHLTLPTNREV